MIAAATAWYNAQHVQAIVGGRRVTDWNDAVNGSTVTDQL
jgi:hypothetical protein